MPGRHYIPAAINLLTTETVERSSAAREYATCPVCVSAPTEVSQNRRQGKTVINGGRAAMTLGLDAVHKAESTDRTDDCSIPTCITFRGLPAGQKFKARLVSLDHAFSASVQLLQRPSAPSYLSLQLTSDH